jgi:phosphoserine aminotransferase
MRIYNFSPGPSALPVEVLQLVQQELFDWRNTGMSVMEISHRSKEFMEMAEQAESDLRNLLAIPLHYKILFLQGGARSQFAMVPMNLLRGKQTADYITTGIWSNFAAKEAKRYCEVNIVASSEDSGYTTIPAQSEWCLNSEAAYFHYVDNETINGVEFSMIPDIDSTPLVSDMSSNLLSRSFDITRFALIYAGAQKNIGIAGLTIVIVREDLLGNFLSFVPSMFDYKVQADNSSMYNTPPTFAWYLTSLIFQWLKNQGGVATIAQCNQRKAQKLYQFIDACDFYDNSVEPQYRSRMNVVFSLKDEQLNDLFLQQAKLVGLVNLKGHKLVGGMRASIYNALPETGVDVLINFMQGFARKYG